MTAPRTLIAEDHPVMREGLAASLAAHGVEVVGAVADGRAALAAVERERPDVVLMDLAMPAMDGLRATEMIRMLHPAVSVVALTFDGSQELHERARRAGASEVVTKDATADAIVAALRRAVSSGRPAPPSPVITRAAPARAPLLSPRELEVLELIATGVAPAEIGSRLYISAKTVKNHLASIYQKLDVTDRTQAVLRALRLGLVSLHDRPATATEIDQTAYQGGAAAGR